MKHKLTVVLTTAAAMLPVVSFAALDYTAAVTDATAEVNGAIAAALPIGALILGAVVGWRVFKRFARG